jgi:hypothetical protein
MTRSRRTLPTLRRPGYALLLGAFLLPALPFPARALADEAPPEALHRGAWALEFEIDPSYSYGVAFYGSATLSAMRFSSERSAWRFGVSFDFRETKDDGETSRFAYPYYTQSDTLDASGSLESHDESHSYALFFHFVRAHPVAGNLVMTVEAGPSLRYSESDFSYENLYPYAPPIMSRYAGSSVTRGAALDANVGVQWLFSKRLALGARIGAFGVYRWGERSVEDEDYRIDGSEYYKRVSRADTKLVEISTTRATLFLTAFL